MSKKLQTVRYLAQNPKHSGLPILTEKEMLAINVSDLLQELAALNGKGLYPQFITVVKGEQVGYRWFRPNAAQNPTGYIVDGQTQTFEIPIDFTVYIDIDEIEAYCHRRIDNMRGAIHNFMDAAFHKQGSFNHG